MSATSTIADVLAGTASWCVVHGKAEKVLPTIPARSFKHVMTDPPYSERTHSKSRRGATLPDIAEFSCRLDRAKEFGFEPLAPKLRRTLAREFARLAERWVLVFCDEDLLDPWRKDLAHVGIEHIRVGLWIKIGGTPQWTGDRPGVAHEFIEIAHAKGTKRWNGGGKLGVWSVPIEANRLGNVGERVFSTQKPTKLLIDLLEDFTDPNDVVLDATCGSGTTLVAAIRTGRRAVGIEKDAKTAELARERCEAEQRGLKLAPARAGQRSIFDVIGGPTP